MTRIFTQRALAIKKLINCAAHSLNGIVFPGKSLRTESEPSRWSRRATTCRPRPPARGTPGRWSPCPARSPRSPRRTRAENTRRPERRHLPSALPTLHASLVGFLCASRQMEQVASAFCMSASVALVPSANGFVRHLVHDHHAPILASRNIACNTGPVRKPRGRPCLPRAPSATRTTAR